MTRFGWMLALTTLLAGCGSPALEGVGALSRAGGFAARQAAGGHTPIGHFPKDEGSGVVASRRHPGVYWAHRDSSMMGGRQEIYAFRVEGGKLGELSPGVKFRAFEVPDIPNHDWEDIAADDEGRLWLGDFGNNGHARQNLALHALAEPDPFHDGKVKVLGSYPFSYPDKPASGRSFNAESLVVVDGLPYILTKAEAPTFYRLPALTPNQPAVLERVSDLAVPAEGLGGLPTGADLSQDGSRLAVTTDGGRVFVFEGRKPGARGAELVRDVAARPPRWSARYNTTGAWEQVEGVAFPRGSRDLVLLSESKKIFYFSAGFYGER